MKILQLRFKNLNSLYGEWFIDFTAPEYVSNGIFSLTGPTGAGKSTILDAICLALYGATPRLGKITKGGNEIISRQTGECYAEVVFESQSGRFRCHFSQRRARKKPDGELQPPRHEISEAQGEGRVIESQIRRVATVIEKKTGMDFERFTRSILLAQGGFDTFLNADAERKSRILEQITGTDIYSGISRRTHERQRDEREKLSILLAESTGITLLEPDQEREIQRDLENKQKEERELVEKTTETGKAITWLTGIDRLKKEVDSLSKEIERSRAEHDLFKPDRDRLNHAIKATELDGEYATLTATRAQQNVDQASLNTEEEKLPELHETAGLNEETLRIAERNVIKAKEDFAKTAPLIQKVRSLDQRVTDLEKTIVSSETAYKKKSARIENDRHLQSLERKKRDIANNALKQVSSYLEAHSRDSWLVGGLAGVEERFSTLLTLEREIAKKATERQKASALLDATDQKLTERLSRLSVKKKELEETRESLEREKRNLTLLLGERLLREYRSEKETLLREMAFTRKIADLENERLTLIEGQPCPLCGARKHPFTEGNVPEPDETEKKIENLTGLIRKAEERESIIKKHEAAEKEALNSLTDEEKREVAIRHEKRSVEKNLKDLMTDLEHGQSDFAERKESLLTNLQPLGVENIPGSDLSSLLSLLRKRLKEWRDQVEKKVEIEKRISDLDGELKRFDALIETQNRALIEHQTTLEQLRNTREEKTLERETLFGIKEPSREEIRLTRAITDSEQTEKSARIAYDNARQRLNSTRTTIASLKERIEGRTPKLRKLESEYATLIRQAGFADEKQFLQARLTASERDELKSKAKDLDDRWTNLQIRRRDRQNRLTDEIAKKITDENLEELEPRFEKCEEKLNQLRDLIAGLRHKLAENSAAQKRVKEKRVAIETQKKECHRWEKLHGLIGSADGKKYRNFAQGLTFELMVAHANRQLEKMTDRYLLIRDEEHPLELNVVDNYQAGEIRSTKNLSGGESFIVSLSLALGLSKMASRNVRVDSLFLDEGFGTLDEETLETALESLSSLHQDDKLIGVISHISALRERISTQITITPISGGKSVVTGPGCGGSLPIEG